jgi:hypothetical protein
MLLEIRPLHHTGQLGDDGVSLILAYLSDLSISLSAELTIQQLPVCFVLYSYYIAERERERWGLPDSHDHFNNRSFLGRDCVPWLEALSTKA